MLPADWKGGDANMWLGTTAETRTGFARRAPHQTAAPARVRFLSLEPLPGPVDMGRTDRLHRIVKDGENGPNHRPADADRLRSIGDQCTAAAVPFPFKQWEGASRKIIKAKGRELDGVVNDGYPLAA